MKTRILFLATVLWVTSGLAVTAWFSTASAQSGRIGQPPPQTPSPALPVASPKVPDPKTSWIADSSDDKYRLVFPTIREGGLRVKFSESEAASHSRNISFIAELNKVAARGYRLTSAMDLEPVGIVRFDESLYEYSWFETRSDLSFATSDLDQNYTALARQGYRLVEKLYGFSHTWTDTASGQDNTETIEFFVVEKERGTQRAAQHVVVSSAPRWRGNPSAEMSTQINEKLADGYYPAKALSKYEVLLEQLKDGEDVPDKPRVLIVRPKWRNDVEKGTNEWAQQGYRLALVSYGIAVMYRNPGGATAVSYVWLDAKKRDFEKQLARLQMRGAVYRMTYPSREGNEDKLIFEQNAVDDGTRREYRVLKFEFEEVMEAADNKVHIGLTSLSKETVKLMNKLVKEGFEVRDLFLSDKVSILLERS